MTLNFITLKWTNYSYEQTLLKTLWEMHSYLVFVSDPYSFDTDPDPAF